ncbi:Bro-N domain-containing protein [Bacteroides acidifaciens]|uniref:BRO-N domain-containing protein n=1 Tax=Bacteroides acidifaciens TaxID=85831 RepID=UPI002557F66B|nr:Bro-N domain-containing protein [Bacteroides acidifaciens]
MISSPEFGEIRSAVVDGTPLFVAKDICDALGISKYRDALTRLDEDERASISVDTLGGKQSMIAVNESGLYTLVFQSRKPEAKAFRKWVTGEVLPNIRKHGVYMTPEVAMSAKNLKRLRKQMLEQMRKYLIEDDLRKCAKRFGMSSMAVHSILKGDFEHNDILAYLQDKAMENREKWFDAYGHGRMTEVLNVLSGNTKP